MPLRNPWKFLCTRLDQNYLYSSTSPLPLVNPWKFQCTKLDQNYLHSCNFTIPLVNPWKFPRKRLEQPYLYSCNFTILLVYLWKSQCTSWLDQTYFNIILRCGISLSLVNSFQPLHIAKGDLIDSCKMRRLVVSS